MIKLLYITNGINGSGGLERVLSIKASYLADNMDYEVHILTLRNGDKNLFFNFSKKITFHDVKVYGSKLFNYFLSYKRGIQKVLDEVKPDIVSVCDDGLKGLMFPLIFRKRTPVIYERHAAKELNLAPNKLLYTIVKMFIKKFDSFVVLTEGNKRDWPRIVCAVIPNPSPYSQAKKNYKKQKTVLAVGSQSYHKGFDLLINVWEIVNKKFPDWNLKIFGKKNISLGLEVLVEKKGLSESIELCPPVVHIDEEYKKASIFALPSRHEGFGMVLIEAMSFGTPCVAFDCPHGPADIITHGEDGFLAENRDIKAFSNYLIQLIKDEELRLSMSKNAIHNVSRYSVDNIVKQWDNLFTKLLDK